MAKAWLHRDMSVLEAMRDIEKRIEEDFRDKSDLRADVYRQIGDAYRTQGLYKDAERNLRKALKLRLELYCEDSAKAAESMYILSGVSHQQGDAAERERLLTKALEIQRRHPLDGNTLLYMIADYGNLLRDTKNDYADALTFYREALEIFRSRYGESHYMSGALKASMVWAHMQRGDYAQAIADTEKAFQSQPNSRIDFYGRPIYPAPNFNKLRQARRVETILLEAYEVEKSRVLPEQDELIDTRRRLSALYSAWGKADIAQRYE